MDRHPQPSPENPYPPIPAVGEGDRAPLFETYREGKFTYAVPVAPGRYQVTLRFFEPEGKKHVFDLAANGKAELKGFDVSAAAGGEMKAAEKSFTVEVKKGGLKLAFDGQAIVSAIEIQPAR